MSEEITIQKAGKTYDDQPRYDVFLNGERVGSVFGNYPMFQRKPRNSRVVTKRWTSKSRYWATENLSGHVIRRDYPTIKTAAQSFKPWKI